MSIKLDRINTSFVEKISEILHDDIKDKTISLVTITDARVTNDLSFVKVYFTTLNDDKKSVLLALNKAKKYIRSKLCEKMDIRKMPEINFVYDESIEYGKKIEDIIERISSNE